MSRATLDRINRRDVISLFGRAAAVAGTALPPASAWAQQTERLRTIGFMGPGTEADPQSQARFVAFRTGLEQFGWKEGRNVRFEYRWPGADAELIKKHAAELVALGPDPILTGLTPGVQALKRKTSTIPILFANVADPVGSGLVPSLAKPGGNVTGFTAVEYAIVGKWLELLKEMAPRTERVLLIGNPDVVFTRSFMRSLELVAASFAVKPIAAEVRNAADIEHAIDAFAVEPNGGLLTVPEFTPSLHRAPIFRMAARHRLPAVYPFRFYATDGVSPPTAQTRSTSIVAPRHMPIVFCAAQSRPTFRCRHRPSSSSRSISRPPRRSTSKYRPPCWRGPTR